MGDFERTFGAGRDAADVIASLTHEYQHSEPCQASSSETMIEVLDNSLALFAQKSRKSFYDEGLMQAALEKYHLDDFVDRPGFDAPLSNEHLLIVREPNGHAAAYVRVFDHEVTLCELCLASNGGEWSFSLVEPIFHRQGWGYSKTGLTLIPTSDYRYLPTLQDFIDTDHKLTLFCNCGRNKDMDLPALIRRFGGDFDLPKRRSEFLSKFKCVSCGSRPMTVQITPNRRQ